MKHLELFGINIAMCFLSGLYLPSGRKIVRSDFAANILAALCVVPIVGMPVYYVATSKPFFFDDLPLSMALFSMMQVFCGAPIVFKLFSFYLKANDFERLFRLWDASLPEEMSLHEIQVFQRRRKILTRFTVGFGASLFINGVLYGVIPYFSSEKKVEHPTWIPYKHQSPEYELYVTFDLVVQTYMCMVVHSFNSLLLLYIAYAEVYCQNLKWSLGNILNSMRTTDDGDVTFHSGSNSLPKTGNGDHSKNNLTSSYKEISSEADAQIRRWIRHHQKLIRYHSELQKIFHVPISVDFTGFVFLICLILLMAIKKSMSTASLITCVVYGINTYTVFYGICSYADLTGLLSETITEDAFGNSWYLYPKKIRTALHIITMNCNRPLVLKAFVIYPVNSNSFAKIFKGSYSFFMFMLQIINRKATDV